MATVASRGSGTPVTSNTTWSTTTNAVDGAVGSNPATYSVWTNTTANAVGYIEISNYHTAFAAIPAGSTINSVTASLRHLESQTTRLADVQLQGYAGATPLGTATTCTRATSARNDTNTVPATLAQLQASTFKMRATATRFNGTQAGTFSIDYIDVTVDYTPPPPAITQAAYQFFDDAGTESGAASLAALNTSVVGQLVAGDGFGVLRVRLQLTTAVATQATDDFQLQWEKNVSGTWTNVTTGGTTVLGYNNPNLTDGAVTTNRLGAGTGSFVAGKISETGDVPNLAITASNFTELVYSLKLLAANLADADTLRFRVLYNGATTVMTYTQTPLITIRGPVVVAGASGGGSGTTAALSVATTVALVGTSDGTSTATATLVTVLPPTVRDEENGVDRVDEGGVTRTLEGVYKFSPLYINWRNAYWVEGKMSLGLADGAAISAMTDDAGTMTFTQSDPAKRALYRSSVVRLNNKPGIDPDGVDDVYVVDPAKYHQHPFTVIIIAAPQDTWSTCNFLYQDWPGPQVAIPRGNHDWGADQGATMFGSLPYGSNYNARLFRTYFNLINSELQTDEDPGSFMFGSLQSTSGLHGIEAMAFSTLNSTGGGRSVADPVAFIGIYSGDVRTDPNWPDFVKWAQEYYGIPTPPVALAGSSGGISTAGATSIIVPVALAGSSAGTGTLGGAPSAYVKYRTFNGTSDFMTFNIAETASQSMFSPGTAAICLRRTRNSTPGSGGSYQEWLSGCSSGGGNSGAVYFEPSDRLDLYTASGTSGGDTIQVVDDWAVCAVSRSNANGTRLHSYKWTTGTWSHTGVGDVAAGGVPGAGGFFEVGNQNGWDQFLAADVAVVAYWHRELSDAEVGTLHQSLADWSALTPNHLWRMDGSPVTDSVGTSTLRSITGTTLTSNDSPLAAPGGGAGADLLITRGLAGASNGLSTTTAAQSVGRPLVAASAGISTTTSALARAVALPAATANATSTTTGALIITRGLASSVAGASTVTAALGVARPLVATSVGVSTTTAAAVAKAVPVASSAAGVATTTAATIVARTLVSGATGISTTTANLIVTRTLVASAAGAATTSANMVASGAGGLAAQVSGTSTVTGALVVARSLAASAAGLSTTTSALTKAVSLAATADGSSTTVAATAVARSLAGASAGVATATGSFVGIVSMVASSNGLATTTASLARAVPMVASSVGVSTVPAALVRVACALAGLADGFSTAVAVPRVALTLSGSADGLSTADALALVLIVGLGGVVVSSSTAAGDLTVIFIIPAYGMWNGQIFQGMQYGDHEVVNFLLVPS